MKEQSPLHVMFQMQRELNARIGIDHSTRTDSERGIWIDRFCTAMAQEVGELRDSVPWKWWSKSQQLDLQNAKVEVVDLFHFLISAAMECGMTADDVFDAYLKKNKVNHERQDSGYVVKDENDCRHI